MVLCHLLGCFPGPLLPSRVRVRPQNPWTSTHPLELRFHVPPSSNWTLHHSALTTVIVDFDMTPICFSTWPFQPDTLNCCFLAFDVSPFPVINLISPSLNSYMDSHEDNAPVRANSVSPQLVSPLSGLSFIDMAWSLDLNVMQHLENTTLTSVQSQTEDEQGDASRQGCTP